MDELLTFFTSGTYQKDNHIGATAIELQNMFKSKTPYLILEKIDGEHVDWKDYYIDLVRIAMSTDNLYEMTEEEIRLWKTFVLFEDGEEVQTVELFKALDIKLTELVECIDIDLTETHTLENVSVCII